MQRPTKFMVEHLNLQLEKEGTCLRYVETERDCDIISYDLRAIDRYLDYSEYKMNLNISKEFENMVRDFFKKYGIENIGFTNTVATIFAVD